MPTLEIIQALTVLLPGFVTMGIIRALCLGESDNEFDKVIKSLIFSLINYTVYAGFVAVWAFLKSTPTSTPTLTEMAPKTPGGLIWLSFIAVSTGLIVAAYKNNDGHRYLRKLKITYRSSRPDIWHDSLVEGFGNYHVLVTLEDKRRLIGWVLRYSDSIDSPALFLTDAAWVGEDGTEISVGNEGILLLPPMKIVSVEFVRSEKDDDVSDERQGDAETEQKHD